ncbi:MAG: formylglycine-generating enzyme family protein [Xanthomonadales bacterium]|nr:formylglycine-generating enzyme family protein [Xanthomonadales bacterium]
MLRALRLLDPALRHEPGAEALTWDAEQVGRSPLSRPLRPEHVSEYRARFRGLPLTLQQAVQCCLQEQHIARGRTTVWLEHLLWQVHSDPAAPTPDCIALGEHARLALQILVEAGAGSSLQADVERFARDVWQRQQHDETWWRTQGDWAVPLLRRAGIEEAPKGMAPKFAWQLQPQSLEYRCYLAQRGDALWVIPAGEAVPAGQRLTPDFSSDRILMEQASVEITPGERIAISAPWLPLGAEAQEILKSLHSVNLQTRSARIEIAEVPRPRWAVEFGRDSRGVYAVGAPLGSHVIRLDALPLDQWQSGDAFLTADFAPRVIHRTPRAELSLGIDREFGNYAELQIDHVVQRLRWIPAGEFLMGSPDDEPERFDDEGPQHRVRITEGFWLSDTACTQALWLAVMGTNPSYFSGNPENPVEQVSFDDVEIFLAKLRAQLPEGVRVELPTEAQWEYACRAGSITAFSFGATVSPAQVNYDGNHPYADAAKGEYRQRTVPVRSLPANAWGLYEMHGNVFEWCRDGCRGYGTVQPGSAEQDPVGPLAPASCALRGGAWIFSARLARSAYRLRYERGDRYHDVGFRWSLRSLRSLSPAARSAGFSGSGRVAGAHAPAVSGPEGRLSLEPEALPSSPGNNEK